MSNIESVRAQIRFHLSEVSTRNEHHTFEHLCQEVAKARICSNVVPATGPVTAGGDQGRDLETFKTYLRADDSLRDSTFLGLVSEGVVVFACSTEQNPAASKIRSDVDKIMKNGRKPDQIYFFSTHNIPVGRRHVLQDEVRAAHGVELDILDAQGLAVHLSDPDLFWVAEQYLHLPSSIYPARPETEEEAWYVSTKERWQHREPTGHNFQEFEELKLALRHAARSEHHRGDVAWWQGKLERYRRPESLDQLSRKATYEIVVADVYASGGLRDHEPEIRTYLNTAAELTAPSDLQDAAVFLFYCRGAFARGLVDLAPLEIDNWRDALARRLEYLLEGTSPEESPSARCSLLDTAGYLAILPLAESSSPFDIDAAMSHWEELLAQVARAPLYPLERFSDFLNSAIELIGDHPRYSDLVRAFDELAGQRLGEGEAGEKARQRAIAWGRTGRLLRGIHELHIAKIKWFAEETLEGSLLSMLLIAQWYRELGLIYASKQYSLAVAALADQSTTARVLRRLPEGVLSAADAEYLGGNWLGFIEMARTTAALLGPLGPTDDERYIAYIERLVYHCSVVLLFCERFGAEDLAEHVRKLLRILDWEDADDLLMPQAREAFEGSADGLWEAMREQLADRPFGDAARTREASWSALGIKWHVTFENDYHTTPGGEEFCAVAQVVLADLADIDLCLLPTSVRVALTVENRSRPELQRKPSNEGSDWDLKLPVEPRPTEDGVSYELQLTMIVLEILQEASMVPSERFWVVVERRFEGGLSTKVFVGKPYRALYVSLVNREEFDSYPRGRATAPAANRPYELRSHGELKWHGDLGPGYDLDDAAEAIARRYERAIVPVRKTVARLGRTPWFCALLSKLRSESWKDWHILQAIANIAINERVSRTVGGKAREAEIQRAAHQLFAQEETNQESRRLPNGLFSEKAVRMHLQIGMTLGARYFGLEDHQITPDFAALERFLTERYRFKADDVEHEPLFGRCDKV